MSYEFCKWGQINAGLQTSLKFNNCHNFGYVYFCDVLDMLDGGIWKCFSERMLKTAFKKCWFQMSTDIHSEKLIKLLKSPIIVLQQAFIKYDLVFCYIYEYFTCIGVYMMLKYSAYIMEWQTLIYRCYLEHTSYLYIFIPVSWQPVNTHLSTHFGHLHNKNKYHLISARRLFFYLRLLHLSKFFCLIVVNLSSFKCWAFNSWWDLQYFTMLVRSLDSMVNLFPTGYNMARHWTFSAALLIKWYP